jgi:hypothetical protein
MKADISESIHQGIVLPLPADRKRTMHSLGGIRINYILFFFIPFIIFACFFCYHMAVSTKQERPFPHSTITHTACHYPQDIVFRLATLPAGSFMFLIYFTIFRYVELQKNKIKFPYGTEQWIYKWAQASVLGFYGAVATIDGAGYPIIHLIGSIFFFLFLYVVAGAMTIVLREMHNWDITVISRSSLLLKRVIVGYITVVAWYCAGSALGESDEDKEDNIYVVIVEWNLAIMGLVWLLTLALDWGNVSVVLKGNFS